MSGAMTSALLTESDHLITANCHAIGSKRRASASF
jgi:hypothetical protein